MKKQKLIIISGPTAVGKSELSIRLAKEIGGEIISADSMQVYRNMDIGTAKITKEEMQGVAHHLIDVLDPKEDFHVVKFQELAKNAIEEINNHGKIPIVVGGTGFYIQALLYDIDFREEDKQSIDMKYQDILEKEGNSALHQRLRDVDPVSADIIHENNSKRVMRALAFFETNGLPISKHNQMEQQKESPYDFSYFVITDEREALYQRINQRVDHMVEAGLVDEVRKLLNNGCKPGSVAMQGIGYKEIISFLQNEYSLDRAIELIKQGSRHYAKRQLTWFRREKFVEWIDRESFFQDTNLIIEFMKDKIYSNGE